MWSEGWAKHPMVMEVLQDKIQIKKARRELIQRGASLVSSPLATLLRRMGLLDGMSVGDNVKSWDVLSILKFIEEHVQENEPILDIGCYASELIVALHKLGYANLTGVDLNPKTREMPYQDCIRYVIANFMKTEFEPASFKIITSISVIEHGFDGQPLLKEMARLLMPGGYFIASFDYWPEKIDTTGVKFFGMDWRIFSKQDVAEFIEQAAGHGLAPVGELHYDGQNTTIECREKKYTFGWLALEKKN